MTLVAKEASLMGQLGFSELLCTNRCPHRQEGGSLSRGSSAGHHAETGKKGNSSLDDQETIWPVYIYSNKTQHPLSVCCLFDTKYNLFFVSSNNHALM